MILIQNYRDVFLPSLLYQPSLVIKNDCKPKALKSSLSRSEVEHLVRDLAQIFSEFDEKLSFVTRVHSTGMQRVDNGALLTAISHPRSHLPYNTEGDFRQTKTTVFI